ncbi:uncharacterized protein LTR77_008156 [Saxophila tyrrhenica]|uniref:DUF1446-domain-containing protein n=1 Tax=Saxophila tyrrhenica TaxID=1690608 RepID=A0AAV9P4Z9_9PEZI|nr:hypothetical protein LTR77_008156 [Saxophila tyrrhenica]
MAPAVRRPVRIAGASGGFSDRVHAISRIASNEEVDVIVGDWLSEMTMTIHGSGKQKARQDPTAAQNAMFAENFMDCFEPAIGDLQSKGIKLAVNAGASDTEKLAQIVRDACHSRGWNDVKVAWIEGDEQTDNVKRLIKQGETFESLMHGRKIQDWEHEIICAQCYLGGLGIAEALKQGADIVIAGRVADAAPTIGAAAYVTGGYCAAFKDLMKKNKHVNLGFPIAAVNNKGECTLTKEANTGGMVTVDSVSSQLLYEIQGPLYYGSDVVAQLEGIQMEQVGEDEVRVTGIKGVPPPDTTKVGISGFAGWQAEYHIYLVGLDIDEKCKMAEDQIKWELGEERLKKFSCLKFMRNGESPIDARNQDIATVDFRIFAQSRDRDLLRMRNPEGFFRISMVNFLMSCPGASLGNDMRQAEGKPFYEYWPALLPQSEVQHRVHMLWSGDVIDMPAPTNTSKHKRQQPSYETEGAVDLSKYGETVRAPLGKVVLGRSGDKASDCNVGFFVRPSPDNELWDWLRSTLTVKRVKQMLGPEEVHKFRKPELRVDRFEMPGIRAVHFLLHDHLDRGYDSCSTYDTLGKNCLEYLRAKTVDMPKHFLEQYTI